MKKMDNKFLSAIGLLFFFFLIMPCGLWRFEVLKLREPPQVFGILFVTVLVLCIKAFITYFAKQNYLFSDHGFQLCLLAVGGFLTIWALQSLYADSNILGNVVHFGSTTVKLNLGFLALSALACLLFSLVTAFITSRVQLSTKDAAENGTRDDAPRVAWYYRLLNYMMGIVSFYLYLLLLIAKGV